MGMLAKALCSLLAAVKVAQEKTHCEHVDECENDHWRPLSRLRLGDMGRMYTPR